MDEPIYTRFVHGYRTLTKCNIENAGEMRKEELFLVIMRILISGSPVSSMEVVP